MDRIDRIKQVRIFLGMDPRPIDPAVEAPIENELKFTESKLKDGSNVSFEKLEIGSPFFIRTASDTIVPAPAGDYILSDDSIVSVGIENLITSIKAAEMPAETEPDPVDPMEPAETEEPEVETPEVPNEVAVLEGRIAKLEEEVNKLVEALTMSNQDFSETKKELSEKIEELAKQPSVVEPIHLREDRKLQIKEKSISEIRLEALDRLQKQK